MEGEREVKTIEVFLKCPDCDTQMLYKQMVNTIYRYKCPNCYTLIDSDIKYPYIKYLKL